MRKRYQDPGNWTIVVDQMSLLSSLSLYSTFIADAKRDGANIVQAIMYDRFSANGKLRSFEASSNLSTLLPVKARFIKAMEGADHKGVLVKGLI